MLQLPSALRAEFEACLQHAGIPKPAHAAYTKWLRYYLDFCQKYYVPHAQQASLPRFLHKLQEKQQTQAQQPQASHAVSRYHELVRVRDSHSGVPSRTNDAPVWSKYLNSPGCRRLRPAHRPHFGLSSAL